MLPFVGKPGPILSIDDELNQAQLWASGLTAAFPMSTMIYFQFVFAAITVVITAGAFLGRMNFLAWALYVPLWLTFSYGVGAFSLWGGGFLAKMGVIDYSGGYVIHVSSGTAGWVGSFWIGPRLHKDRLDNRPNNVLAALTGAGILWIGWNGFNGGDPYAASTDAGVAVLNTNLTTAVSLLTFPWLSMNLVAKNNAFFHHFDDTLGVFHTHLVAGFVGGFLTGLFATIDGNAAFGLTTPGGAIYDHGRQVWLQIVGFLFIFGWNLAWTSLILLFIKYVCRIPLRMSEEALLAGDEFVHGEAAYVFDELEGDPATLGTKENEADLEAAAGANATRETGNNVAV
ncbi:hypothetical protein ABW21_db0207156 [Orbilia brochopaga]|nr:hypothetical protein ABW21_db0207156 [Drechslerella brochopaga]